MLDSLVRVSRRVGTLHDPDLGPLLITKRQHAQHNSITMDPIAPYTQPPRSHRAVVSSLQSTPEAAAFIPDKTGTSLLHAVLKQTKAIGTDNAS